MHYLNTTRHLKTPPTQDTLDHLTKVLEEQIVPSAATVSGLQSISWMLSHDGRTMQAYSGWLSPDDVLRAERSEQHVRNGAMINDLLGGLASPQQHSYYRLIGEHRFA